MNAGDAFGLTVLGRTQVCRSVTQALATGMLESPVLLVSSPLLRARESADIAAELLGVSPTIDARLSERGFGDFELEPDDRYERVWAADRRDATHRSWGVARAKPGSLSGQTRRRRVPRSGMERHFV